NVECEEKDPASILNFYKSLIRLRRREAALNSGNLQLLFLGIKNVLAYHRQSGSEKILVAMNMSPHTETISVKSEQGKKLQTLISTATSISAQRDPEHLNLEPFTVYVGKYH
ncbi:MAG: alpha-glucosidase C-terminal domain-containing protein, partial [Candidatus Obscuribacterales bacterium]|nr:alpha-glucosidase C-terminal domain-containing protein [Candidatus Obscuribacterales bacterium]